MCDWNVNFLCGTERHYFAALLTEQCFRILITMLGRYGWESVSGSDRRLLLRYQTGAR